MIENQIGKRFAEALSDSIQDEAALKEALENLRSMDDGMQANPKISKLFIHPSIPDKTKMALVASMCDTLSTGETVRNILQLLVERKKMAYLKNIREYFEKMVADRLNQVRVQVISASAMNDEQINKLKSSLDQILGKSAEIEASVDESLIGGLRVHVGSWVADATIQNRLALLQRSIKKEEVLSES